MQRHATSLADNWIALPEGRIALADTGTANASVVVCLHAVGHGSGDYAALLRLCGSRLRLIALDWPGHGRSDTSSLPPSVQSSAAVLGQVLDALGLGSVHLVGNSIGGGAALVLAARAPERVRSLVLSNPAGLDKGGLGGRMFTRWRAGQFDRATRRPARYEQWFAAYCRTVLPRAPATAQRERITAAGLEMAPLLAQAWRGFGEPAADLRPLLPAVAQPVLMAWARDDRQVSWARNRDAVAQLSGACVQQFDAGHTPALETPEPFAAALEHFLETLA